MIILIRHGESQANMDQSLHRKLPDHEIALSSRGQDQAHEAGIKLREYLEESTRKLYHRLDLHAIYLWNSPYRRTRDTAKLISDAFNYNTDKQLFLNKKENILLCEQQFGVFDGLEDDEIKEKFPEEFKVWSLCKKYNGKFYARYPMGESPFDAACRIQQSFRDFKSGIKSTKDIHVIVCHGTVVKLFEMMWFNFNPEWFASAKTIGNCGFSVIETYQQKEPNWVFSGYKRGQLVQAA